MQAKFTFSLEKNNGTQVYYSCVLFPFSSIVNGKTVREWLEHCLAVLAGARENVSE